MAGDSVDSESSRNKRLKTSVSSQIQNSKCKSKLEDEPYLHENQPQVAENSPSRNCAICFSEDGKAIRGEIDSCDHYFCFLCIMEWSKTESRCPMCRRRFVTIRRPPKDGVFASERMIKVPVRDQANTTGSFDPYAEVLCNACHSTKDEHLLLLCDLCDSAAHTYCVGLGFTVPEGDWFCHDCTISKAEHANSETNNELEDEDTTNALALPKVVRQEAHRPVIDTPPSRVESSSNASALPKVVRREAHHPVIDRPPSRVSSDSSRVLPSAVPRRRTIAMDEVTDLGARTFPSVAKKLSESGARTLDRCRNVHSRIKAMRENWNALRSGSLTFSSGSRAHCYSQKHDNDTVLHDRSGQVEIASSKSSQQLTNEDGIHSNDIDRAWKMYDIAKSKHCACGQTSSLRSSKLPPSNASGSKEKTDVSSNHGRKSQQLGYSSVGKTVGEKPLEHCSFGKEIKKNQRRELERERPRRGFTETAAACSSSLSACFPRLREPSLSKTTSSVVDGTCQLNRLETLKKSVNAASSNISSEQDQPACSISHKASDSFDAKSKPSASSLEVDLLKGTTRLKNVSDDTNVKKPDDAKSEIQSLVKLNLKLLSRDKQLGLATFKEIARAATHTILAACGLEHQKKYGAYSFSSFECSHKGLSEQMPRSNLMPTSCQQCFNSFVKDVVNSIMLDTIGRAKLT